MTNYIIIALSVIILLSYIFDITSKYSRIPSTVLLIALGIGLQLIFRSTGVKIPNMEPVLPVVGTLGLILIVLEASLDLKIEKNKKVLLVKSVSSAVILFIIFSGGLTYILVRFYDYSLANSLLNSIPPGIISSSVAISSARHLSSDQREFIIYESSVSDIFGIMIFDFILLNQNNVGLGLANFILNTLLTVLIAIITISGLALLLHKAKYHVNYVIIMTAVVLVYTLAKLSYLPALFLVLAFGLALSNYRFVEHSFINRFVDFRKFRTDVESFKKIMGELTFLVRSFFFIIFGYYTSVAGLYNSANLLIAAVITGSIFLLRFIYFRIVLKISSPALILFGPRGLITILLFLSIPAASSIPLINSEVITLMILMTLVVMMIGNIFPGKKSRIYK